VATLGSAAGSGTGLLRPDRAALPDGELGYLASRLGFGHEPRPAEVDATLRMLRATPPRVVVGLLGEVAGFEERAGFEEVGVPVAVAVGSKDHLTPPRLARRLAESFPGATLNEYPGAGHMLMYERREEIDALLDSLSARAACG